MILNNRQKAQLRKLANPLRPLGQIGKEGLSDNLLSFLDDALESHELIKVRVLKNCPLTIDEISVEISRQLKCAWVLGVGRVMILYRKSRENRRIKLVK